MRKYYGKEKCRILKQIRAEIARQNDIEWVVSECKHKGDCRGTCPKCEYEVRQLEEALARREALGKKVAVVGISAGIALSVSGCANPFGTTSGEPLPPESKHAAGSGNRPAETEEATDVIAGGMILDTETDIAVDGEMLMGDPLPETEPESEIDIPLPGEEPESETDILLPGEEPLEGEILPPFDTDETSEDDELMGYIVEDDLP